MRNNRDRPNGFTTCDMLIDNLSEEKIKEILDNGFELYGTKSGGTKREKDEGKKELVDLRDIKVQTEEEVYSTLNKMAKENQYFVYCGPLLININPGPNKVKNYLNLQSWVKETENKDEEEWKPHLYSFMYYVYQTMVADKKDQVVNMMGQIGSGKTFNIVHILEYYCCMVGKENYQLETFDNIHKSIQLLHIMGSIFRENNLESTSCGILLRLGFNEENKICNFDLEAKILDLTLPFSENGRSFSILHSFIACATSELKRSFCLPEDSIHLNFFKKFTKNFPKQTQERFLLNDYEIWTRFHSLLKFFEFSKDEIIEVLQVFSFILSLNELGVTKTTTGKKTKYTVAKGRFFNGIEKNLKIEENDLEQGFGTFKDENDVKNTLISLMKYSYYICFEYIIKKIKLKLKNFFQSINGKSQDNNNNNPNQAASLQNNKKNNASKKNFDTGKSASKGKNMNNNNTNNSKSSRQATGNNNNNNNNNMNNTSINNDTHIKYINFLDFPGEVKDQTLGGLVTNLANECIQLIAGNSYSSVVEKLISERLFLNLFKPLHSYHVVRALIGEKGLLSFLSNKFTEDNFNAMINESITKNYYKKCIDFPEKDSTSKNKNLFKMVLKCSHKTVFYNYESLYLETKSIVNNLKAYKIFSKSENTIIKSEFENVIKLNTNIQNYVNENLLALFKPIENMTPFVIYCLHSDNSYNIFFGKKDEVLKEGSSGIPIQLTQNMLKKSLTIPVIFWEWFGFHEWMKFKDFLQLFEEPYKKIRNYNRNATNKGEPLPEDEFNNMDDDEKVNSILTACYVNRNAVIGNSYLIMKKGTLDKIKSKMNKFINKMNKTSQENANKKGKKPDLISLYPTEKEQPQLQRKRTFKVQCHLNMIDGDNNTNNKNMNKQKNPLDPIQENQYSKYNIYRIMSNTTDDDLEKHEFSEEEANRLLLKEKKNKKNNVVVPSQNYFSMVQSLLESNKKSNYQIFDYSPFLNEVLSIQRKYREYKAYQQRLLRNYIISKVIMIQKFYRGRRTRKRFERLKICLAAIIKIQRAWRDRYLFVNNKAQYIQEKFRSMFNRQKYKRKAKRYQQCLLSGEEYCDTSDEEKKAKIAKKKKLKALEDERKARLERMQKKRADNIPPKPNKKSSIEKKQKPKVFKEYILDDKNKIKGKGGNTSRSQHKNKKEKNRIDPSKITDKDELISAILLDDDLMRENDKKNREIANQKGVSKQIKYELLHFDPKDSSRTNNKDPNKKQKIEDKLLEYGELLKQKKAQNQVEKLKKEEMQNSFKPKINKYNPSYKNTDVYKNSSFAGIEQKSFSERAKYFQEMKQNRMNEITKTTKVDPDAAEYTFKPKLTEKAKNKKRSVEDLYKWNKEKEKRNEERLIKKKQEEEQEIHDLLATPSIDKNSKRILDNKKQKEKQQKKKQAEENKKLPEQETEHEEEKGIDLWPDMGQVNIQYAIVDKKPENVFKEGEEEEEEDDAAQSKENNGDKIFEVEDDDEDEQEYSIE